MSSVPCCGAVAPFYSTTAPQRQTGRSQHHSVKRAPTAPQRQTGRSQHHSVKRAAQTALTCQQPAGVRAGVAGVASHSARASATASQRQLQHHSVKRAGHSTTASNGQITALQRQTGSYSTTASNGQVTAPQRQTGSPNSPHLPATCRSKGRSSRSSQPQC